MLLADMVKFQVQGAELWAVGELELSDLAEFESACNYVLSRTTGDFLLDLSAVDHIASVYLNVLASLRRRVAEGGRRLVLRPSPVVRQLLEMTGASEAFPMTEA
jgi:anti-anti-sigma factor